MSEQSAGVNYRLIIESTIDSKDLPKLVKFLGNLSVGETAVNFQIGGEVLDVDIETKAEQPLPPATVMDFYEYASDAGYDLKNATRLWNMLSGSKHRVSQPKDQVYFYKDESTNNKFMDVSSLKNFIESDAGPYKGFGLISMDFLRGFVENWVEISKTKPVLDEG